MEDATHPAELELSEPVCCCLEQDDLLVLTAENSSNRLLRLGSHHQTYLLQAVWKMAWGSP